MGNGKRGELERAQEIWEEGWKSRLGFLSLRLTALLPAASLHTTAPWQGRSGGEQAEGAPTWGGGGEA